MQIKTEVKATINQIKQLIAEKYSISLDFDLEIVDEIVEVGEFVTDDKWVTVPSNWKNENCPTLNGRTKIEVQYRCGTTAEGLAHGWTSGWKQEAHQFDIVRYRKVHNTK